MEDYILIGNIPSSFAPGATITAVIWGAGIGSGAPPRAAADEMVPAGGDPWAEGATAVSASQGAGFGSGGTAPPRAVTDNAVLAGGDFWGEGAMAVSWGAGISSGGTNLSCVDNVC